MKKASANQFTPNVNWRAICIGFFVAIMIVSISSSFSRFLYSDSLHNRANTTSPRAAGAPSAPSLNPITPNPNYNGHINLTWSSSTGATTYYVYRNTSSFIVTTGLTPINSTGSTSVQDTIVINGTYFYAVVAGNSTGNSSLSSCQSVAVKLILFFDNFENGTSQWNMTGLWHLTGSTSSWPNSYHSFSHSMWFGNESTGTYEAVMGTPVSGNLETVPINLSVASSAFLDFYQWQNTEDDPYAELSSVQVSTDNIHWVTIYQNSYDIAPWAEQVLDISNFCGNPSVWVNFFFDSIYQFGNSFRGWLIDDVQILTVYIPSAPTLSIISSNPSYNGSVSLTWNAPLTATTYYLYRSTSSITSTFGLSPIITTVGTSAADSISSNGRYYYIVVAGNAFGNSTISNCPSVQVTLQRPDPTTLNIISPNPDRTGQVNIVWTNANGANIYYVYRNTSTITSTAGLAPIITTGIPSAQDIPPAFGTYYYVVVAGNAYGNSTISSCQSVLWVPPPANYIMSVGAPFNWIDASVGGTLFPQDTEYESVNLPFLFPFYDHNYSSAFISAEGWLSFVYPYPSDSPQPYPSSSPNYAYAIAPFWSDMDYWSSQSQVYMENGPNFWVMEWQNMVNYYDNMVGTFEVVLYSNGSIIFQYQSLSDTSLGYTCGLNYGDGVTANRYTKLSSTTANFAILFTPLPLVITGPADFDYVFGTTGHSITWTITSPYINLATYGIYENGSTNATGSWSIGIPVTFNIDGLALGCYNFSIVANDGHGNVIKDVVIVNVRYVVITHSADFSYPERSLGNTILWTVFARLNATTNYAIFRNGNQITGGSWISGQTITLIVDGLLIGTYNFSINVFDGLGNSTSAFVVVTVVPNVSYLLVSAPANLNYTLASTGNGITWIITAQNYANGSYTVFEDGKVLSTGSWVAPGGQVVISIDGLGLGKHNITIVLQDCWGMSMQNTVWIVVVPPSNPLLDPLFVYLICAAAGLAGVFIPYWIWYKKRSQFRR